MKVSGNGKSNGKSNGKLPANPEGTCKVFCGNLSFQIDDDAIKAFLEPDCGEFAIHVANILARA